MLLPLRNGKGDKKRSAADAGDTSYAETEVYTHPAKKIARPRSTSTSADKDDQPESICKECASTENSDSFITLRLKNPLIQNGLGVMATLKNLILILILFRAVSKTLNS